MDDVILSDDEINALSDYLYVNELILQCKDSAIYINREEWESLEKRMLTIKHD